jgi:hypothetical protein
LATPIPHPGLKYHGYTATSIYHHQSFFFACKSNPSYDKMSSMHVDQVFESIDNFKEALRNWAIVDHFEYRWAFSDNVTDSVNIGTVTHQ